MFTLTLIHVLALPFILTVKNKKKPNRLFQNYWCAQDLAVTQIQHARFLIHKKRIKPPLPNIMTNTHIVQILHVNVI